MYILFLDSYTYRSKKKAEGTANPSFTSFALQRIDEKDEAYQESVIRGSAGTMYSGEFQVQETDLDR